MKIKRNSGKKFLIFVYILVILTGSASIIFDFASNNILGWILITLGVLNLVVTLFRK